MMNRRGFLGAILASGMAPAIGHAGILMPVRSIILPPRLSEKGVYISEDMPLDPHPWKYWMDLHEAQADFNRALRNGEPVEHFYEEVGSFESFRFIRS